MINGEYRVEDEIYIYEFMSCVAQKDMYDNMYIYYIMCLLSVEVEVLFEFYSYGDAKRDEIFHVSHYFGATNSVVDVGDNCGRTGHTLDYLICFLFFSIIIIFPYHSSYTYIIYKSFPIQKLF